MATSTQMEAPEAEPLYRYDRNASDSDSEFDYDLSSAENKNTKRKTETDMRIFSSFLLTMNELRPAETIDPIELNRYLTTFFSVIKKHDGNEYEPASLRGMLCSIERYLRARKYPKSLTRDIVFISTRNTLKDRQLVLRELAKDAKKGKQDTLTSSSIEKLKQLYNAKEFGPYSPMAVINSLCFAFVVHLKIRKAIDHKQLLWGDIVLKTHDSREYLCYEPVQGRDYFRQRLNNLSHYRIYSHSDPGSPADPVAVYKLYATRRPSQALAPDTPFYLGLAVSSQALDQQSLWFKTSPMGVNKLNDLVRMIREITGNLTVSVSSSVNSIMENNSATYRPTATTVNRHPCYVPRGSHHRTSSDSSSRPADEKCLTSTAQAPPNPDLHDEEMQVSEATPWNDSPESVDEENAGNKAEDKPEPTATDPQQSPLTAIDDVDTTRHPARTTQLVKQDIQTIMDSLKESDRHDVQEWIAETYGHKETLCKTCDEPKQFSINFTWNPSDTVVKATVQSSPVEIKQQSSDLGSESKVTNTFHMSQEGMHNNAPSFKFKDGDNIKQNYCDKYEDQISKGKQKLCSVADCISSTPFMLDKRAAFDDNVREEKIPRIHREYDISNAPHHTRDHAQIHNSTAEKNDSNIATTTCDEGSTARMAAGNVKPWFPPWAFDPRLAMYFRQSLVPMYGDCSGHLDNSNSSDHN